MRKKTVNLKSVEKPGEGVSSIWEPKEAYILRYCYLRPLLIHVVLQLEGTWKDHVTHLQPCPSSQQALTQQSPQMKNEPTFKIFRNTCPLPNSNPSCQKDCITNQGPSCPLPFSIILSVTIQQQALIACVKKKILILESCESLAYSANIHSLSPSSVGEVYSSARMTFVCHITCLVQWDVNRCDTNTGLR